MRQKSHRMETHCKSLISLWLDAYFHLQEDNLRFLFYVNKHNYVIGFFSSSLHDRLEKEQKIPEVHIPKPMSENFDDTISQLNVHKRVPITSKSPDDTDLSLNQTVDESLERPVSSIFDILKEFAVFTFTIMYSKIHMNLHTYNILTCLPCI